MCIQRLTKTGLAAFAVLVGSLLFGAPVVLAAAPEAPVTREAKSVTATTAVLRGELNPKAADLEAEEYDFAYAPSSTECTGGLVAPEPAATAIGDLKEAVSLNVTGLQPNREYSFCVVAIHTPLGEASEPTYGLPSTFKTHAAPPVVIGESSPSSTPFEARLEAVVNPNNQTTSCEFEYGLTTAYGNKVPCEQATLEGFGEDGVGVSIAHLAPKTAYHFRIVLENATHEKTVGSDREVTTLESVKPAVESEGSSGVTPFEATLEAQVNPKYQETTYSFQYATKATGEKLEGTIVTVKGTGTLSGVGAQGVSVSTGTVLTPDTPYFYRVIATNATGAVEGKVEEVKTLVVEKPTVENPSASVQSPFEVILEAQVNPDYQETTYSFQYATKATGEVLEGTIVTLKGTGPISGAGAQTVSAATGTVLTPGTKYYYRATATNKTGTTEGKVEKLETPVLVKPVVEGQNASVQSPFEATLEATVNPEYQETTCKFEYSTKASFPLGETTSITCPASLGNGGGGVGTSVPVSGLKSATTYHYRVVATNGTGTTEGAGEFTTLTAEAPTIESESVSFLSSTRATLEAQINPNYQATTYTFEYATEESVLLEGNATKLPAGSIPAGFGGQSTHANIGDVLSPGTTYYYRVVVKNATGTTAGMVIVAHFKTPIPPQASTGAAQDVTHSSATVSGTVNPEGQETHYTIQYGTSTSYGYSTVPVDVGSEVTPIATGAIVLSLLTPDTTYHYRLLAINSAGESTPGADGTFTTEPGPPPPETIEPTPITPSAPLTAAPVGSTFPNLTAIAPIPGPKESAEIIGTKTKTLTRAQKLAKALRACKKDAKGKQRASCEKRARAEHGKSTKKKGK